MKLNGTKKLKFNFKKNFQIWIFKDKYLNKLKNIYLNKKNSKININYLNKI